MSLREFTDRLGGEWRVWDNTPESVHPLLRESGYLRSYEGGWLVFQSADGRTKLRLTPIPAGWFAPSLDELREWLERATPVRGTPIASSPVASSPVERREDAADIAVAPDSRGTRTFRFPGGRYWTVAECLLPERRLGPRRGARRVLRFSAGARILDRTSWPREWRSYSDEQLAELLASGFPRESVTTTGAPRRRASDVA